MKSEHLFIIRLGDGRHFEYEGTLDGAKRKASKLATHTDCSYNQYKRHNKATVPPRTASRFSLASS